MDTAMRDLEQIREQEPGRGNARRTAVMALATLATVALVFAVGVMIGDATEADEPPPQDSLDALDRAAGLAPVDGEDDGPAEPQVDPASLTFPEALVDRDETARPEVAAALAAAEAELKHPDPLPRETGSASDPSGDRLPAAVAASGNAGLATLARAPRRGGAPADGTASRNKARAKRGRPGKYTLQVISYRTPEEAEAFAKGLRARGHRAFVTSADIPERGRHYRVRIGPFDSRREVDAYRSDFEDTERMNTYVVKQEDKDA